MATTARFGPGRIQEPDFVQVSQVVAEASCRFPQIICRKLHQNGAARQEAVLTWGIGSGIACYATAPAPLDISVFSYIMFYSLRNTGYSCQVDSVPVGI